jgi:nitroreductase
MNTIELLLNHRSVRRYQNCAIPQEVLNRVLECGMRGPNTGNMQIYSVVVTQEPELKSQLAQLHFGQGASCAAYLTVCVDINRYHHWCRLRGCDEPYDNFLWLMSGTVDASICAQNICVAAEAEELGCCYLGTVQYNTAKIAQLLDLPKGVVPVVCLSMGYPDEEPALSERLPLEGVVHYEKYHDYSDDDIEKVHEVREQFPFNQEMVRQNKTRNLAELFTAIRYPKTTNVSVSRDLLDFVKQAGFMNQ